MLTDTFVTHEQNMVGPGEVDDELQDEVREECTEKYGAVDKCVVFEVIGRPVPPEETVRIFVKFKQPSDAQKGEPRACSYGETTLISCLMQLSIIIAAVAGLSGRFFGGRKVRAGLFDDAKFDRMELMG
jgi:splicing factor 45